MSWSRLASCSCPSLLRRRRDFLLLAGALAHRALGRWLVAATEPGFTFGCAGGADEQAAPRLAPPQIVGCASCVPVCSRTLKPAMRPSQKQNRHCAGWPYPPPVAPTLATSSAVAQALQRCFHRRTCQPTRAAVLLPADPSRRGRYAEALDRATLLAAEEPNAADVQLACATLLNRLHEPDAAPPRLRPSARAVLRPIDQLMEDEDPSLLLLESARRPGPSCSRCRQSKTASVQPCRSIRAVLSASRTNRSSLSSWPLHRGLRERQRGARRLSDPDPRTKARHGAAACLRTSRAARRFHPVAGFFFVAGLSIVDAGPQSSSPSMVMGLLSSVEAQLNVLADSGRRCCTRHWLTAIAAMARHGAFSRGILAPMLDLAGKCVK